MTVSTTKWAEIKCKNNVSKSNTYDVTDIWVKEKIRLAHIFSGRIPEQEMH